MSFPDFHQMTRREIEDYLIEKSLVEPGFRTRLIENPRETLSEIGLPIGPKVKINVMVEEPGSFCIVLPRVLDDSRELAVEELESVSGGNGSPVDKFFGYL